MEILELENIVTENKNSIDGFKIRLYPVKSELMNQKMSVALKIKSMKNIETTEKDTKCRLLRGKSSKHVIGM